MVPALHRVPPRARLPPHSPPTSPRPRRTTRPGDRVAALDFSFSNHGVKKSARCRSGELSRGRRILAPPGRRKKSRQPLWRSARTRHARLRGAPRRACGIFAVLRHRPSSGWLRDPEAGSDGPSRASEGAQANEGASGACGGRAGGRTTRAGSTRRAGVDDSPNLHPARRKSDPVALGSISRGRGLYTCRFAPRHGLALLAEARRPARPRCAVHPFARDTREGRGGGAERPRRRTRRATCASRNAASAPRVRPHWGRGRVTGEGRGAKGTRRSGGSDPVPRAGMRASCSVAGRLAARVRSSVVAEEARSVGVWGGAHVVEVHRPMHAWCGRVDRCARRGCAVSVLLSRVSPLPLSLLSSCSRS